MNDATTRPRLLASMGRLLCGFLMIFFGVLGIAVGSSELSDWSALAPGSRVYFSLSFLAGDTLAVSGAVVLFRSSKVLLWAGTCAGVILLLNQFIAIWLNTLLCYTPG